MEETLSKLVEHIETIAPLTWEIALAQVQVQIAQKAIGLTLLVLMLCTSVIWLIKSWNEEDSDGDFFARYALSVVTVLLFVPIFLTVTSLIGRLMNPEYYAIKILMELAGL